MEDKEFYFDVVLQVYRDAEGIHYAVGSGFDDTNEGDGLAAYGTVDTVEEALWVVKREVDSLLDNVEL